MTSHKSEKHRLIKGLLMALGVYVCYIFLNLFNEKMYLQPHSGTNTLTKDQMIVDLIILENRHQ